MRWTFRYWPPCLMGLLLLPLLARDFVYREALPGYSYHFPRDHFAHEDFRTEWWYYTGNVKEGKGARFGFELVFFRQGARHDSDNPSAWVIQNLYSAHAALTEVSGKHFWYEERLNRGGPGMAGASFDGQRIWNGNWSSQWNGEQQTLTVITGTFRFQLELRPEKPPVIHGENGISQKAPAPGKASHYVSLPLLRVSGTIATGGESSRVSGTAWMDHEWFTRQLTSEQKGWNWFSAQLNNNTELMVGELRRKDNGVDPYSGGTFIDDKGKPHHLRRDDFSLQSLSFWTSPETKARYPIEWRIRVPSFNIDLTCRAVLPSQELRATQGGTSYWEGAVEYSGTQAGVGYLEMTGYNGSVRME